MPLIINSDGKIRDFTNRQRSLRTIAFEELENYSPHEIKQQYGDKPISDIVDRIIIDADKIIECTQKAVEKVDKDADDYQH